MVCRRRSVLIEPVLGWFTPAKSLLSLVAAIIFQELDIVDAAPAAAWNVNAVGLSRGCELGLARHGICDRDRQAADLDVAFHPQRRVVRDLDFLRGEILDQPIVDELFERRGHGEGLEVRCAHGIDHARHVGDRRQAGRLRKTVGELVAETRSAPNDRRNARLVNEIDVEARQLLGCTFHALDRLVHVVVGQLPDRERDRRHVDAFGRRLVELEHRARRNRGREDHPHVQPPSGNALSHAAAPGVNARSSGSWPDHSGTLAPVAAMTSLHFLVSAVITASISADELPTTSKPCSPRRSLNFPSATAVFTSPASRSTTRCGVLAGASNPNHPLSSYPARPASCMVGTCGMSREREGDAIANILPLPPAASAMAEGGPVKITSTTPAATSVMAGAVPR